MSGVNDLLERFKAWSRSSDAVRHGARMCYAEFTDVRRNAWKPVSEPPTEADADEWGRIVIKFGSNIQTVTAQHAADACIEGMADYWARINDVVLLPGDT